MKRALIAVTGLLGLSLGLFGQSFPTAGATWQGTTGTIAGPLPFRQALCGDTTINGLQYARYSDISYDMQGNAVENYHMAIRADGPLVWFVYEGENEERLLYDFSLKVGDEITLPIVFLLVDSVTLKVESIDSVDVGGQAHKRINFEANQIGFSDSWIEGVGSLFGNVSRGLAAFDAISELWCFRRNGSLEFSTVHDAECDFEYACLVNGWEEAEQPAAAFTLAPTVSGGHLQFDNPHSFETILRAYRLDGKLAAEYGPFGQGRHEVYCGQLPAAMYVFQVLEKNKNISLQHFKIIVGM